MTKMQLQSRTVVDDGQGVSGAGVGAPDGLEGSRATADADPDGNGILLRLSIWLADLSVEAAGADGGGNAAVSEQGARDSAGLTPLKRSKSRLS